MSSISQKNLSFLSNGSTNVLGRNRLAVQAQEAKDAADAIIKANVNAGDIRVECWVFDHTQHGVAYSALVFAAIDIAPQATNSTVRTTGVLLIEGSAEPKAPIVVQFNNRPVEVPRGPADAIDMTFMTKVDRFVEGKIGQVEQGATIICVSPMVAPRDFNFKDEHACYTLFASMLQAMHAPIIQSRPTYQVIDLTKLVSDEQILTEVNFGQDSVLGADGMPIRADIVIKTSIVKRQAVSAAKAGMNEGDTFSLARTTAYMDMIYVQPPQQQIYMQPGFGMPQQDTRRFAPRLVITSVDNYYGSDVPAMLVNILGMLALQGNGLWRAALLPRQSMVKGKIDLHNIGALNIEGNLPDVPGFDQHGFGQMVDTGAGFSLQDAAMFMGRLILPDVLVSMVIGRNTAEGWGNAVWAEAARGNQEAIDTILQGADTLTGGNFSRFYNSRANPVQMTADNTGSLQDCMLSGYYIDQNGEKRSVHDFDYLAVMNAAGLQNPAIGAMWSNSRAFNPAKPVQVRLAEQRRMISETFHTNVTFTGVDRMVTLMPDFLKAMYAAIQALSVPINLSAQNPFMDNPGGRVSFEGLQGLLYSQNGAGVSPFGMGGQNTGGFGRNVFSGTNY